MATAKFPPALAERINALREDEHLREQLQHRVSDLKAAKSASAAATISTLTPRQQLVQQLAQKNASVLGMAAVGAPAPAPSAAASPRIPKAGRRKPRSPPPSNAAAGGSSTSASASHTVPPLPLAERPPPLPEKSEWAAGLIESARGHRVRDPLEAGSSGASLVRRREKGLELGGAFRTGVGDTEVERLEQAASSCAPLDVYSGGSPSVTPRRSSSARWISGDFLHTRVEHSRMADTTLLANHRAPFLEASKRAQLALRQRDRSAELSARVRPILPARAIRLPRAAAAVAEDGMSSSLDQVEMATARMLLSTSLSLYRK
jgi:hypothetical protein